MISSYSHFFYAEWGKELILGSATDVYERGDLLIKFPESVLDSGRIFTAFRTKC